MSLPDAHAIAEAASGARIASQLQHQSALARFQNLQKCGSKILLSASLLTVSYRIEAPRMGPMSQIMQMIPGMSNLMPAGNRAQQISDLYGEIR